MKMKYMNIKNLFSLFDHASFMILSIAMIPRPRCLYLWSLAYMRNIRYHHAACSRILCISVNWISSRMWHVQHGTKVQASNLIHHDSITPAYGRARYALISPHGNNRLHAGARSQAALGKGRMGWITTVACFLVDVHLQTCTYWQWLCT